MHLLYITRKYPPAIGGMEKVSAALAREFAARGPTELISWGGTQKLLPFFYIWALFKSLYLVPRKGITHVHIGDPVLSPVGLILRAIFGVHITITVHGLDITFGFPPYQAVVPALVARYEAVVTISRATRDECVKRGIPGKVCFVIPCGVYPEEYSALPDRKLLERLAGMPLKGKTVLVTVGRLVKRKGVDWFIANVMPALSEHTVYLVIGKGPLADSLRTLVSGKRLPGHVKLLGGIPEHELKAVYASSDIFIMPNVPMTGNMEGFGIVAIEASAAGLPVIASATDALRDTVTDGKNGILVPPLDKEAWIRAVREAAARRFDRDTIRKWTAAHFDWKEIGGMYWRVLSSVSGGSHVS